VTALLMGYRDIEAARQFFIDALGFEETWVVADDDGKVTRAHVQFGDTVLMLGSPGAHGVLNPSEAGGLTHLIVIQVENLDQHHARARDSGATIIVEPAARPWGRDYELRDNEGYVFSFFEE
jgi:MerR family transcriptional regulator, thiopeptide resistance regulator